MLPIGPLMIEHRLIEKMIKVVDAELDRIVKTRKADVCFIDTVVDFIRTYADRCHHGKEEDILFRELKKKPITGEHRKIMGELRREHVQGRETVKKLVLAKESYGKGNKRSVDEIIELFKKLAEFYPVHIVKEDRHFFIPVMKYFSDEEKDAMLRESWDFDRKLIHEKYKNMVEELKGKH